MTMMMTTMMMPRYSGGDSDRRMQLLQHPAFPSFNTPMPTYGCLQNVLSNGYFQEY